MQSNTPSEISPCSDILARVQELVTALEYANESCRAAYQVALREGKDTNWVPFQQALEHSLDIQHKAMFPPNPSYVTLPPLEASTFIPRKP